MDPKELWQRITEAVEIAETGSIDGAHHKMWVIDQMVRILLGSEYDAWVVRYNADPEYDDWDVGIAP